MQNKYSIFLVEDDKNFGAVLKSYLEINNYTVYWIDDGKNALMNFQKSFFDLCILDIMLPNIDGFSIAEAIKKINPEIQFIFLTAKTLKEDILKGYQIGADDYITKPFDSEILLCKINAIICRKNNVNSPDNKGQYKIGNNFFDYNLRCLQVGQKQFNLSPKEADLLKMLCESVNRLLTREKTLNSIWGMNDYFTTRSMDVYISKLRKYFKNDNSIEFASLHSKGFRLLVKDQ